jgi:dTMP kinase
VTTARRLARGVFVALEGIDGAGKSTQARHLASSFAEQGYPVRLLHEPSDSPWGRRLRDSLRAGRRVLSPSQELDLFLLDRRYHVAAHIQPALAARTLVLTDRYYFSTIAYQGALGIDPEAIRRCNEAFAPLPDVVFVLLLSPAQALARIRASRPGGGDAFEQEAYLTRVDALFRALRGPYICPIEADQPMDDVTAIMQQKLQEILSGLAVPEPAEGVEPPS